MSRLIFWVLLGTVLLLPIPFGAIHAWTYPLLAIMVAALVGLWAFHHLIRGDPIPVPIRKIWLPALLFGMVIVWAGIQMSPWTPASLHNPIWAETSEILKRKIQGYISVDPHATSTAMMRLLSYAGIFWLALQFGRSSKRANQVFYSVAIAGLVYASYGIAVELTDAKKVLWYDKDRYADNLTSTFRYKNGYATYAGLSIICALTMLTRTLSGEDFAAMGAREKTRVLITLLFERVWFLLVGIIIVFSALLLSDSRGGLVVTLIAGAAFFVALNLSRNLLLPFRQSFSGALIVAVVSTIYIGGSKVVDRLANANTDTRELIYSQTIEAISEHPVIGWGLGTFEPVFAKYQPPQMNRRFIRAHNEYLDNALGLGIPATAALVTCFIWLAGICLRGIRIRKRNHHFPAAGFSLLLLVGLHSIVDFTLQIPAVTATFALILGTCVAQSWNNKGTKAPPPE